MSTLIGLVTLTSDYETGMLVASKNFGTLGLWVLELFAMYVTDGQTDGRMHNNPTYSKTM